MPAPIRAWTLNLKYDSTPTGFEPGPSIWISAKRPQYGLALIRGDQARTEVQKLLLEIQALIIRPKSLARGFLHFMQTPRYWIL